MGLSKDLISQFVRITNDNTKTKKDSTIFGTIVESDGVLYVQLDGSELLTPMSKTSKVKKGDRVIVTIKNNSVIVTGNMTDPSAGNTDIDEVKESISGIDAESIRNKISEFEILIADAVTTEELDVQVARIDELRTDNATIREQLDAANADIDELQTDNVTVKETLTANEADISKLKTDKLDATIARAEFATIVNLDATNANLHNLEATYGEFESLATGKFSATEASIKDLQTNKLSATDIDGKYANIDFSNIGEAAITKFFAVSGLIKDVVVGSGTITGQLVGVTITGDLIEGGTVVADKLVIKGEDGLYYKLNTDGVITEAEQTDYNSLNGKIITAKSITATKISVDDLVAFDATIGGFNITESALYSGVKQSVDSSTDGIYLDKDGQFSVGNSEKFIKFYKTENDYQLDIYADVIAFKASGMTVEDTINEAVNEVQVDADEAASTANDAQTRVAAAESAIEMLSESISMLVTDGNGASLMTQTENGWTFSTADIQDAVNTTSENLNTLANELGDTSSAVDILQQAVADLGIIAEYVKIGTYEGEPCIELGEGDSDFKLLITNTRIMFREGSGVPAYFNNQSMYIKKAVVEEELQQGGFVWKVRSNGNMGLVWKGVTS